MTIAGHHSVAELQDLVAAKDFDIVKVQDAFDAFAPTWRESDPPALAVWASDWNKFLERYAFARKAATRKIAIASTLLGAPNALLPAEDEWNGILRALTPREGVLTPDSFQGLYSRLTDASKQGVSFDGQPQPSNLSDADLVAFQAADATLRALPDVPGITPGVELSTSTKVLVGLGIAAILVVALRR